MTPTVILSPHPDDAVLSCWHTLTAPGDVTVINLFAGSPTNGTPVAWWDRLTGATDPIQRMCERLAEDRQALALAGKAPVNLRFLDDQYRTDAQPIEEIVEELRAWLESETAVLAPAGIGAHPDHLLTRSAALQLHEDGYTVTLYAELPHAIRRGWPKTTRESPQGTPPRIDDADWEQALGQIDRARAPTTVHTLSEQQRLHKIAAVRSYRTQLDALNAMAYRPLDAPDTLRHEITWKLP